MMETIIDIYELAGTNINKSYSRTFSNVRAWIVPASNETVALYGGMGSGQSFSFRIADNDVSLLSQQCKFKVVNTQVSGFATNDVFISVGDVKRQRIMGRFYISGVCYKSENAS